MSSNNYNSSGESDSFIFIVFIVAIILIMLLTHNFYLIAGIWKLIRIIQLTVFSWMPDWVPFYGDLQIKTGLTFLWENMSTEITPETVSSFDDHYMKWFTWMPGVIMMFFGARHIAKADNIGTKYDMESILIKAAPNYSYLQDFLKNRPEKMDLNYKRNDPASKKWGASVDPSEFALLSPPLGLEKEAKKNKALNCPIWDGKDDFDLDLAERAFKAQLGSMYSGIESLTAPEKGLYDFLLSRISIDLSHMTELTELFIRDIANKGKSTIKLDSYGVSARDLHSKLTTIVNLKLKKKNSTLNSILEKNSLREIVLSKPLGNTYRQITGEEIMARHAFVRTGLMTLLDLARSSGVVACDQFSWVKGADRVLWYCLSSVGRKVSFAESAGCFAHWLIEVQIGRPLAHPEVSEAVEGLYKALKLDVDPNA